MTFVEEGIEGSSESIIVEFVGGDIPEQIGGVLVSPIGDVNQGIGLGQPSPDEQFRNIAVREFELRIGRGMLIDNVGDVELFEQREDQGQGPEIAGGIVDMRCDKRGHRRFSKSKARNREGEEAKS